MLSSTVHLRCLTRGFKHYNLAYNATCKFSSTTAIKSTDSLIYRENFATRHNGIGSVDQEEMLKAINVKVI